jgi:Ca2+-binding RTX toxin-like protein
MPTIVTRASKGAPLTWNEADANFNNLNTAVSNSVGSTDSTDLNLKTNNINRVFLDTLGNVRLCGDGTALATTATDRFTYVPSCAGPPTGVPTNLGAGAIPMVVDTTNSKLYFRIGGAWVSTTLA